MGRWIADGGLRLRIEGLSELSASRQAALWVAQGVVALTVVVAVVWAVRQCRRERRLTFDAALCLGYMSQFWLDPLIGFRHRTWLYDAAMVHTSSWGPYIPGWTSPHQDQQVEPLFFGWSGYFSGVAWIFLIGIVMKRIIRRLWPRLRGARFALTVLGVAVLIDLPIELFYIYSGAFSISGGWPPLTLFSGHWYQLPLNYVAFIGIFWAGLPYLVRHYHIENGPDTTILRGIQRVPEHRRTLVQTLAVIGFLNLCVVAFCLCFWLSGLAGGEAPAGSLPYPFR
ncbi:hypothetical protein GCM10010493_07500 [Streptomyces lavendulae subsp. grasserius]